MSATPLHGDAGFWPRQRVLVTGGRGFLGSHVVEQLRSLGCEQVIAPGSRDLDLLVQDAVRATLDESRPTIVLHLAAEVGGIGANDAAPGRFFYANMLMGTLLIEEARRARVRRFVQIGTACSYPKNTAVPFREDDLWDGYPEETNAPYGIAKKALLVQLQAYRRQYGFDGIFLIPANLYGPRDHFDLEKSHVVPALIRKFLEATEQNAPEVAVWGSGRPTREFLHVRDCARGILLAAERYGDAEPVNLASGEEISIADLARLVARLTGYRGEVTFDASRPDGQPRRCLDTSRAHARFGFEATIRLEDGLRETIEWYRARRAASAPPAMATAASS